MPSFTSGITALLSPHQLFRGFSSQQQQQELKQQSAAGNNGGSSAAPGTARAGESKIETDISKFPISPELVQRLQTEFKIKNLYPIQAQVFQHVYEGKDLIGKSKTGTGKTLAFLLPLVDRWMRTRSAKPRQPKCTWARVAAAAVGPQTFCPASSLNRSYFRLCMHAYSRSLLVRMRVLACPRMRVVFFGT